MIASLRGQVLAVRPDHAVVEVGGVGFAVAASGRTLAELRPGAQALLATRLVVREDSLTLYGFSDDDERDAFDVLLQVAGVGPKLALAILGTLTPEELRRAVHGEDTAALMRVSGIGKKVASRLLLELAGKLAPPVVADAPAASPDVDQEIVAALAQLGWNARDAAQAVAAVGPGTRADVLRAALQYLGANHG